MSEMRRVRCQKCRAFFVLPEGITSGICPECTDKREKKIKEVHTLVKERPGITPIELNSMTGVPINVIMKIIADGVVEQQ